MSRRNEMKNLAEGLSGSIADLSRSVDEKRIIELDPDQIDVDDQVRTNFNEILELSASIKQDGQQTPCTVGPLNTDTGKYPLYYGERRWRAVKLIAGMKLRVIIDPVPRTPAELIRGQFTENEQRASLLPHEVGLTIQRYKKAKLAEGIKLTLSDIAKDMNKPIGYINMHAQFADLPEPIESLITDGFTRDAELLLSLKTFWKHQPEDCRAFIAHCRENPELLTREAARTKAREAKGGKDPKLKEKTDAPSTIPGGKVDDGAGQGNNNVPPTTVDQQSGNNDQISNQQLVETAPKDIPKTDSESNKQSDETEPGNMSVTQNAGVGSEKQSARSRNGNVRNIDSNRIVIAVRVAQDTTLVAGLLLVDRVVENQPGKCVVELNVNGVPNLKIVSTDQIEIMSVAEMVTDD